MTTYFPNYKFVAFVCRHIRYIGQSDIGDKSHNTLVRSCLDIATSVNIGKFLSEMGFV